MKVKIEFTVDIDEELWADYFGPNVPVREDVKDRCRYLVLGQLAEDGVLK
jgi:hypothetical protein